MTLYYIRTPYALEVWIIAAMYISVWIEMCLFNPYSAGIDFSRQNLTSVDVRFWRLKSIPAL